MINTPWPAQLDLLHQGHTSPWQADPAAAAAAPADAAIPAQVLTTIQTLTKPWGSAGG